MRGATGTPPFIFVFSPISIHAPHAGRDASCACVMCIPHYFNPRAPCGARPLAISTLTPVCPFQSTRPMRGATGNLDFGSTELEQFQSTRPMRGATFAAACSPPSPRNFNPRAPCGARLSSPSCPFLPDRDFNPRAPCGARPFLVRHERAAGKFQSTRPMRGATSSSTHGLVPFVTFQSPRPMRGATS